MIYEIDTDQDYYDVSINNLQDDWNRDKMEAHILFGHLPDDKLVFGARHNLFPGLRYSNDSLSKGKLPSLCVGCMMGRMKRSNRSPITDHDWDVFNKICSDWIPTTVKSYNGHTGYFLFKDYFSDFIQVYLANFGLYW